MKFEKQFAENYTSDLLKKYKIKVHARSKTSSGHARWKSRSIKIPYPTSIDRFGVCLHEIKHIIDGNKGKRYEQEFASDMYALKSMQAIGYDISDWERRMRYHSLSRIAMAANRGLDLSKINDEIKSFFSEVDWNKWKGNKIFVSYDHSGKTQYGYSIQYTASMSKNEIEMFLNRKGLMIEKSESDDSTYGMWIVRSNGEKYGSTFENLSQIVSHYKLAI